MHADQLVVNIYLERAIAEFDTNPLSVRLIRRMATELPELFMVAALEYLDSPEESSAHQILTSLMLRHHSVFEEVADPSRGSHRRSVTLFRRLVKVDLSFDVKLARKLPDRSGSNHAEAFDGPRSCRVLDVFDETSVGRRLLPILSHLVDSPDPQIAAKATLFIGRRLQNAEWASRQLNRSDPGARASAVEAIWGLNSPSAQALLEDCVRDESNRVAANALVGLHMLGKPGIVEQVTEMVTASVPTFRSTAAWTMGQIGDAAFVPPLTELLRDEHPEVRSAALRSLLQIRRAEAAAPEAIAVEEPVVPEPVVEEPVSTPEPDVPLIDMDIRLDGKTFATRRKTARIG
ncbi:MAG: HEAT repeat domain-containing protein [Bryobacteraceae bacterium]|jgi:hypothetical protein